MSLYPTKDEILNALEEPNANAVRVLNEWRKAGRGTPLTTERLTALVYLLWPSAQSGTRPAPSVESYTLYAYNVMAHKIILDESRPSIISTLHELGHALYGISELKACAFSIALFRAVYPRSYAKLVWDGHMLKKATAQ